MMHSTEKSFVISSIIGDARRRLISNKR
jgi:hypothetical protein